MMNGRDTRNISLDGRGGVPATIMRGCSASDVIINTSIDNAIEVTYQFGTNGNTITISEYNLARF